MKKAVNATQVSKFAGNVDVSDLHPSVRSQALSALHAIDRLESSFGWALSLIGLGARANPLPR